MKSFWKDAVCMQCVPLLNTTKKVVVQNNQKSQYTAETKLLGLFACTSQMHEEYNMEVE